MQGKAGPIPQGYSIGGRDGQGQASKIGSRRLGRILSQGILELSEEEAVFLEVKVALAKVLRSRRLGRHLSQMEAAELLHSSQSRVAKMEAADKSVSLDLLLRSVLRLGGTGAEMAEALNRGR